MTSYQIRHLCQLASALVWLACLLLLIGVSVRTLLSAVPDSTRQAADEPGRRAGQPALNQRSERVVATNHQWAGPDGPSGQ